MGYDNNLITFILPALSISISNSYRKNNKLSKRFIILFIVSLISIIKVWSATSVFVMILILGLYILLKNKKDDTNIFKILVLVILAFFLAIVIFRVQDIFKYIVVDMLKKDLTFTGRTLIWDNFMEHINLAPLIGYEVQTSEKMIFEYGAGHAHDYYLNVLFQGGIIALIAFFRVINVTVKKITNQHFLKGSGILAMILFGYLFAYIFEAYSTNFNFVIVLLVIYYYEEIVKEEKAK